MKRLVDYVICASLFAFLGGFFYARMEATGWDWRCLVVECRINKR